jgi:hypothetical protein
MEKIAIRARFGLKTLASAQHWQENLEAVARSNPRVPRRNKRPDLNQFH